jgi:muramoyltetrapeptide carboxypeptidase LdcA involved in peptidoglycan recycling
MNKPKRLKQGDKVAIVSLSSGILGEPYCKHQLQLGIERLKEFGLEPRFMPNALKGMNYLRDNPRARADDLKEAFFDDEIKGIICVIGGDETFKLLSYHIEDEQFIAKVKGNPKIFTGFSDTTNNHLMFYKLGMVSFYGPNFLSDLAELGREMLPYTKKTFQAFFAGESGYEILSSPVWYEERTDFSANALGTERVCHEETKSYEVLYGSGKIKGKLLGGCLESLYDGYTGSRYPEQYEIYQKYQLMPDREEWKDKILFFETSEERPTPQVFERYIQELIKQGVFAAVRGVIVGKPQNEVYYDEYKAILTKYAKEYELPMIYNVNFGHAYPHTLLPYGVEAMLDLDEKRINITENFLI